MTDEDLATLAEVTKQTITARRTEKGIASLREQLGNPLEKFDDVLGALSDVEIGLRAGRSKNAVLKRRRKKNVETYRPRTDTPSRA